MIFFDSRYIDSEIRRAQDSRNGKIRFAVYREWPNVNTQFFYYEWVEGDRIDAVAERFYGSAVFWWRVLDANPDILNPITIAPGTVLRIPNG